MLNLEDVQHTVVPDELRDLYISKGRLVMYPRKSRIISLGETVHRCYYVLKGCCAYMHLDIEGISRAFNLLTSGASFGETPSLLEKTADVDVLCLEDTTIYEVVFSDLLRDISKEQAVLLMKYTVKVNMNLHLLFRIFSMLDTMQRILLFFRIYAVNMSVNQTEWQTVYLRLTHERLAEIVGSGRVTVTLQINNLKQAGYVKTDGRFIQFHRSIISDSFILNGCREIRDAHAEF